VKTYGLPKSSRITSSRDFARIYGLRHSAGNRHLLVFAAKNDLGHTRFGLSVSKKHGNAVKRTRLKRLLREAFRLSRPTLPSGLDLILIPRQGSGAELADYRQSLVRIAAQLARRLGVEEGR